MRTKKNIQPKIIHVIFDIVIAIHLMKTFSSFFFQRWIFFRANFIVCLLQFDVHHWDDRIKNAIDENMAHCYGIKRIKLDHYVGYCSPQLHIILSAMASHRPSGRNLSNWKNSPFWKDFGNTLPPREQFSAFNFESKKTNIVVVKIWMSIIGTKVQVVLKLSIYRSLFLWIRSIRWTYAIKDHSPENS